MFLGDARISWKCKKQESVSKSSTEAEYRSISAACSEIILLWSILSKLGYSQATPTLLYADNTSVIQIVPMLLMANGGSWRKVKNPP